MVDGTNSKRSSFYFHPVLVLVLVLVLSTADQITCAGKIALLKINKKAKYQDQLTQGVIVEQTTGLTNEMNKKGSNWVRVSGAGTWLKMCVLIVLKNRFGGNFLSSGMRLSQASGCRSALDSLVDYSRHFQLVFFSIII